MSTPDRHAWFCLIKPASIQYIWQDIALQNVLLVRYPTFELSSAHHGARRLCKCVDLSGYICTSVLMEAQQNPYVPTERADVDRREGSVRLLAAMP